MWFIYIIISIIIIFFVKLFINLSKDKEDLSGIKLADKFNVIVESLNDVAFNGEGELTYLENKKHFNLYKQGSNQIINFLYSQGVLSITWKYKYFQKEMVYRKNLTNVRNLSIFQQQKIANGLIKEMSYKVEKHKAEVLAGY